MFDNLRGSGVHVSAHQDDPLLHLPGAVVGPPARDGVRRVPAARGGGELPAAVQRGAAAAHEAAVRRVVLPYIGQLRQLAVAVGGGREELSRADTVHGGASSDEESWVFGMEYHSIYCSRRT